MILLADSGSTKTKWLLRERGVDVASMQTQGINPMHQSEEVIRDILEKELREWLGGRKIERVEFYGAGCAEMSSCEALRQMVSHATGCGDVIVASDIVGAAKGLLGSERGIACIIGTGANSVLWDGEKVVSNVHAGGFILGDEGSGAVLGRRLVSDFVKGVAPENFMKILGEEMGLDYFKIVSKVYREPLPNRWLAGFAKLLGEHRDEEYVQRLLREEFGRFFERNVKQYDGWRELPVGFVGSIAFCFERELREVGEQMGIHVGKIMRTPF